jgi:hypothetical protein
MAKCVVCENDVIEHNLFRQVFYCNNGRCTRLGLLTVFVLIEKTKVPELPETGADKPVVEEGADESPRDQH